MRYLHAKLATDIVALASTTNREVYLRKDKIRVDAKSILGVMSLVSLDGVWVESVDHDIAMAIENLLWS